MRLILRLGVGLGLGVGLNRDAVAFAAIVTVVGCCRVKVITVIITTTLGFPNGIVIAVVVLEVTRTPITGIATRGEPHRRFPVDIRQGDRRCLFLPVVSLRRCQRLVLLLLISLLLLRSTVRSLPVRRP